LKPTFSDITTAYGAFNATFLTFRASKYQEHVTTLAKFFTAPGYVRFRVANETIESPKGFVS
jgi:hypothetical protein